MQGHYIEGYITVNGNMVFHTYWSLNGDLKYAMEWCLKRIEEYSVLEMLNEMGECKLKVRYVQSMVQTPMNFAEYVDPKYAIGENNAQ